MMKVSTTLILALVLGGVGTYYYFSGGGSEEGEAPVATGKVLALEEGDALVSLEIERGKTKEEKEEQSIALQRKGTGWFLVRPVFYPAENILVEGMASALAFSRRERRFPSEEAPEEDFGFEESEIKIRVQTQKHPERRTLLLGRDSPVGSGVYARWEGEKEIFLLPLPVKAALEKSGYSLRKKKLFRVDWDEVSWMYAKTGERRFRLEKKDKVWRWTEPPLQREVPMEQVSDLIYSFQSLYIKEFLDEAHPQWEKFDLVDHKIFLAVGHQDGEEKLAVGAPAKGRDARYAVRTSENIVLLISEKNLKSLLELFEVTYQTLAGGASQNADQGNSGSARRDSGEDREGLSEVGQGSL